MAVNPTLAPPTYNSPGFRRVASSTRPTDFVKAVGTEPRLVSPPANHHRSHLVCPQTNVNPWFDLRPVTIPAGQTKRTLCSVYLYLRDLANGRLRKLQANPIASR